MKLGTDFHHTSGHCWKALESLRDWYSQATYGDLCVMIDWFEGQGHIVNFCVGASEAYISTAWS